MSSFPQTHTLKRVVLTTIFSSLLSTLSAGIVLLFNESEKGAFLYFITMVFGNIVFPTFIAVLFYYYVKRRVEFRNQIKTFILRILTLLLLYLLCLVLWSVLDVIVYNSGFSNLTIEAIAVDFVSEFSGFIVITVLLAILIPSIDLLFDRKRLITKVVETPHRR